MGHYRATGDPSAGYRSGIRSRNLNVSKSRPRIVLMAAALAAAVGSGVLAGYSAQAVVGVPATGADFAFTARLSIGDGERACSGALVDPQWVLTAASCFAADPQAGFDIPAGVPAKATTVTVGTAAGTAIPVTELVPRTDRDVVMAKLATPVGDIPPVVVGSTAPTAGEQLRVAGFGRTKTEWAPSGLHTAAFGVDSADATTLAISGKSATDAICAGDTGGPALREKDGKVELVALNTRSWQGGCFGSEETRTGALETRVDDIGSWIRQIRALPQESQTTSGDFNGDGKEDIAAFYNNGTAADGKKLSSLYIFTSTGSGFKAPVKAWTSTGSFSWDASKLTSGDYTGDGKADVGILYDGGTVDGKSTTSLYTFTSTGSGFKAPVKAWTSPGNFSWDASKVTSGDYTGDGKADVGILYNGGTVDGKSTTSLFTLSSSGTGFNAAVKAWTSPGNFSWDASKVTSGDYTGDGKADVGILYNGGTVDGKSTTSLFTLSSSGTGFNAAVKEWTSSGSFSWDASKLTSGDYTGDKKADVGILYDNGTATDGKKLSSLFTFTSTGTGFNAPAKQWASTGSFSWDASKLTSGDYTGDKKADVGILYDNGTTADGRKVDSLFTFTSTGPAINAPVKQWQDSVN
ncbi:FG-GAP-like repeat-containing protein [Streptomyces mesophilus]|uniref:FG-GAP-like repeat-containing protein n=1 Tax=Streptomyces mesophilus TaxID=1775132 RepID=UPI0033180784